MRVNSACKGFLTIVMLAVFFTASSFMGLDLPAKQLNLIIRQMGHQLLLQAGDSTSRVLPVTEINKGTFSLRFESEFSFNNDSLIFLSQELLPKSQFPSGYTVTVHDDKNSDIVYGFQVNNTATDITACVGRSQPRGIYRIEIAFPDMFAMSEKTPESTARTTVQKSKASSQLPGDPIVVDADQKISNTSSDESTTATLQSELPIITDTQQTNPLFSLIFSGMLVLSGVTLLVVRVGNKLKPAPVATQDLSIIKESAPELSTLGKFSFDVREQRLLSGTQVISLTDKECRILELLHTNFGELIPRETLMQKVWLDEGVITGRSLDMFVSKLRKKLSSDPELSITNVHGKGYKLESIHSSDL